MPDLLHRGSTGEDVRKLQVRLNVWRQFDLRATGSYDAHTEAAVREFQLATRIPATGEVDHGTWSELMDLTDAVLGVV